MLGHTHTAAAVGRSPEPNPNLPFGSSPTFHVCRLPLITVCMQVVELVMGTDMKQHFALLSQFTNAVSAQRLKQHQHQNQQQAAAATASPPADGAAGGGGGGGGFARAGGAAGAGGGRKKGRTLSGIMSKSTDGDRTKSGPPSM